MRDTRSTVVAVLALVLISVGFIDGAVHDIPLERIVRSSTFGGVVEVVGVTVSDRVGGSTWVRAKVLETWRGCDRSIVRFDISMLVAHDISRAVPGERIVLFLHDQRIAYSGMGRLPLFERDGEVRVAVWRGIRVPDGIETQSGPYDHAPGVLSIKKADLRVFVKRFEEVAREEVKRIPSLPKSE